MSLDFNNYYFNTAKSVIENINQKKIENIVKQLNILRKNKGRIFFIGCGGSAANASHAVNDFRKLANIESYCVTDNVSELTARINDDGWSNSFSDWLKISNLNSKDAIFVFSVGGGNKKQNVSTNIVKAVDLAIQRKSKIFGIVGRDGGYVYKKKPKNVLLLNIPKKIFITPLTESFQALIWHCIITNPMLKKNKTKW